MASRAALIERTSHDTSYTTKHTIKITSNMTCQILSHSQNKLPIAPEEVYMGEGETLVEVRGAHTTWQRAGGPVPPHGVGAPWPSSDSSLDSVSCRGK